MVSETSKPQAVELNDTGASDALAVNLQILSPSVGVNRPLLFPELPAATTIKQLKDKIRDALPLRPADEHQRLIHRGRALLRESDSLLDVFGADALQTPDRQTIHLVIRDPIDSHSSSPAPTTGRGPSPAGGSQTSTSTPQPSAQLRFGPQPPAAFTRRTHSQPAAAADSHARIPSPAPSHAAFQTDPTATFQQQHQNMTNWISQIQREAMARAMVHQNQRGRAHMGMRGIGDSSGGHGQHLGTSGDPNGGRASPAPTHTVYREAIGPNGQSYQVQVETVIRSSVPGQQAGLSPLDVQNILRGAESNQATATLASTMQRSASGASIHGRPVNQPGATTLFHGQAIPMAGSGRATPDLGTRQLHGMGAASAPALANASSPRQGLEVYILSSPEGPRALLVNNSTSETYYTPRLRPQTSMPRLRNAASFPNLAHASSSSSSPQTFLHQQQQQQVQQQQQAQQQQQVQQQQQTQQQQQAQQEQQQVQQEQQQVQQEQQQVQQEQQQVQQEQQRREQEEEQQQREREEEHLRNREHYHRYQQYLYQQHILPQHLWPQQAPPVIPPRNPQQQQPPAQPVQANNAGAVNNQAPALGAGQHPGLHPGNPPAAGILPLFFRAWPHIWLIVRLAVFVWLFTSPTSSWSRWFTVICLAVFVFLLSTGILNGVAENAWRPMGRHLQHMLPAPEQHVRRQQRQQAGPGNAQERQHLTQAAEIDPAQMAARLVAENERQNWLGVQFRRLERAVLLFVASIAPGVAERHIATLEADAQAQENSRQAMAGVVAATEAATEREAAAAAVEAEGTAATTDIRAAEGGENRNTSNNAVEAEVQAEVPQEDDERREAGGNVQADGVVEDLIAL